MFVSCFRYFWFTHRKLDSELVPFDSEIEITLRNLRRVRRIEESMTENIDQNLNVNNKRVEVLVTRHRTLDD